MNIGLLIVAVGLAFLARNSLVEDWFQQRIEEIHAFNEDCINRAAYQKMLNYEELPSYERVLFDLRGWSYRHFFPALPRAE